MREIDREYPRPQFVRKQWTNLNGKWNFAFDDGNGGELCWFFYSFPCGLKINVPFSYETELSGIGDTTMHPNVWYNRTFIKPDMREDQRLILHFEGSDYLTKVWVNGIKIGENVGGYHRFSFDITDALKEGINDITVKAEDSYSDLQPRGKQSTRPESFACFYTRNTGIWKTVWCEVVNKNRIDNVLIEPDYDRGEVQFTFDLSLDQEAELDIDIEFDGDKIASSSHKVDGNKYVVTLDLGDGVKHWSQDEPNLYDVRFSLRKDGKCIDTVDSYFGVRKVECKDGKFCINGEPVYMRMILDQGYWPQSALTPPSIDALEEDLAQTFAFGYNGVRKHQKVEDDRYYYLCDKTGMLLWSEMANCMGYDVPSGKSFTEQWLKTVKQHYNHPCVVTWVPFNETWGIHDLRHERESQQYVDSVVLATREIDTSRPIISNDGWEHTLSDILTTHDYLQDADKLLERFRDHWDDIMLADSSNKWSGFGEGQKIFAEGYTYKGQPFMMSEYGGISIDGGAGWGYGSSVKDTDEYIERLAKLTSAIYSLPQFCGFCLTQLTDIEQEANGLMYYDRSPKFTEEQIDKIREINLNQ